MCTCVVWVARCCCAISCENIYLVLFDAAVSRAAALLLAAAVLLAAAALIASQQILLRFW